MPRSYRSLRSLQDDKLGLIKCETRDEISYPGNWYLSEVKEGPEKDKRVDFHPWRERSFDKVDYQISIIVNQIDSFLSLSLWLDNKFASYPEEARKLITREKVDFNNFPGEKVLKETSMAGVYNIYK